MIRTTPGVTPSEQAWRDGVVVVAARAAVDDEAQLLRHALRGHLHGHDRVRAGLFHERWVKRL